MVLDSSLENKQTCLNCFLIHVCCFSVSTVEIEYYLGLAQKALKHDK